MDRTKNAVLLETVLRLVNESEGFLLIGKISNGKRLLADAKNILENMVDRKTPPKRQPKPRGAKKPGRYPGF